MSKKPENVSISASSNPELHGKRDTVQFLRLYNRWRRGDPSLEQPCPRVLGEMIDAACDEIETKRDILPTRH